MKVALFYLSHNPRAHRDVVIGYLNYDSYGFHIRTEIVEAEDEAAALNLAKPMNDETFMNAHAVTPQIQQKLETGALVGISVGALTTGTTGKVDAALASTIQPPSVVPAVFAPDTVVEVKRPLPVGKPEPKK